MSKLQELLSKTDFCINKAADGQQKTDRPQLVISEEMIREIHSRLCEESGNGQDSSYRNVPAAAPHSEYKHPSAEDLPHLMGHLSDQIFSSQFTLHPVELAAMAHKRLLDIYPFKYKNEETAIALMNLLLMQLGYPPPVDSLRQSVSIQRCIDAIPKYWRYRTLINSNC